MKSIYSFEVNKANGETETLEKYEGRPFLVVNTASKCGLTPQFKELQELYERYGKEGFEILGFPCAQFNNQEFEDQSETMEFCQRNYGVTFPMHEKVDVNGEHAHPLFAHLTKNQNDSSTEAIEWNFAKFLIDGKGNLVKRYAPAVSPKEIEEDMKELL
ncbi:glutathione peroxidase [Planomicrobium sp. YIM 101495]|uniref:glutathione peroxidase n=1 Tax=Planomicrobium sp. YIM 101495 TaxID=2665160 RepID=UPI0012B848D4|nr:glutathione peroxidase [Planomicrobium sp. YIM 101495]MTD32121.1 redoxin domain-containing protein [Planomicrobium sp. YIM 101495]